MHRHEQHVLVVGATEEASAQQRANGKVERRLCFLGYSAPYLAFSPIAWKATPIFDGNRDGMHGHDDLHERVLVDSERSSERLVTRHDCVDARTESVHIE